MSGGGEKKAGYSPRKAKNGGRGDKKEGPVKHSKAQGPVQELWHLRPLEGRLQEAAEEGAQGGGPCRTGGTKESIVAPDNGEHRVSTPGAVRRQA